MSGRLDVPPQLLAETAKLEDGSGRGLLDRARQEVDDLLRDRSMLTPGARLELLVQAVGDVLDVERRHGFLRFYSIMEARRRLCQWRENSSRRRQVLREPGEYVPEP